MKNGALKNSIRITVFAVLALLTVAGCYRVLSWKDTMGDYLSSVRALYATDRSLVDVLFVGSSHCYAGINPDVLWRDYGIAGFDMAISGQDRTSAYYYTQEALKTQTPKVVAVDLLATLYDESLRWNTYRSVLSMKSGRNQVRMVLEETEDPAERAEYILKWPVIHGRYRELGAYDFTENPYNTYGRGYCYRFASEPVEYHSEVHSSTEMVPISDANRQWVDDFLALADEKGFSLVFLQIPHEMNQEEKEIYNGVIAYIRECDATVLTEDVLYGGGALNIGWDYMDAGHLNAGGGEKLTDYLGEWLSDNYELADHRGDPRYVQWDESLTYAEHLYLEQELAQELSPEEFFGALAGQTEVILFVRTMNPEETAWTAGEAAGLIGADASVAEEPGIWVFKDGELSGQVCGTGPQQLVLDPDAAHFLAVTAETDEADTAPGATGFQVILDGEPVLADHGGLSACVYDCRLQRITGTAYY